MPATSGSVTMAIRPQPDRDDGNPAERTWEKYNRRFDGLDVICLMCGGWCRLMPGDPASPFGPCCSGGGQ